ncbi:MAG: 50S ribosomal protein L34 [Candidatus Omnitrophica bacterium]|nr:50S ribosomal protein L34 [Candidatus Omnitrophota bacterium]
MRKHLKTPTKIVAKRRQGFRQRMSTRSGRRTLSRRRKKGRKQICI